MTLCVGQANLLQFEIVDLGFANSALHILFSHDIQRARQTP